MTADCVHLDEPGVLNFSAMLKAYFALLRKHFLKIYPIVFHQSPNRVNTFRCDSKSIRIFFLM